jgi:hypothetical protein
MGKAIILSASAAALMTAATFTSANAGGVVSPAIAKAPTLSQDSLLEDVGYRRRRRWRRGLGIGAGLLTLGIIGAIASDRAYSRRYYYDDVPRRRCRRWRRWCRDGNDRACWKFDTRC